jgi:hypothetical protein
MVVTHAFLGSHKGFRDEPNHRDRVPDDPERIDAMKKRIEGIWAAAVAKRTAAPLKFGARK